MAKKSFLGFNVVTHDNFSEETLAEYSVTALKNFVEDYELDFSAYAETIPSLKKEQCIEIIFDAALEEKIGENRDKNRKNPELEKSTTVKTAEKPVAKSTGPAKIEALPEVEKIKPSQNAQAAKKGFAKGLEKSGEAFGLLAGVVMVPWYLIRG